MTTTSVLVFGDLHYSHEPPASRRDSYQAEIDLMLGEILSIAKKIGSDAVLSVGDHFHRKGRTSHAEVRSLLFRYRLLNDLCGLYAIPGNHDMVGHNLATAKESQPLGVLERAGVLHLLSDAPAKISKAVAAVGVPYFPNPTPASVADYAASQLATISRPEACVVLMHHDVMGRASAEAYARAVRKATGCPTALCNGHIHEQAWSMPVGEDTVYVATGSLARTSVAEREVRPCVASITFRDRARPRVTEIPLASALPVSEAFDPESLAARPEENGDLDKFVELIGGESSEEKIDVRSEARLLGAELSIPAPGVDEAISILDGSYHRP